MRFITGDELGNLKILRYDSTSTENKFQAKIGLAASSGVNGASVQAISVSKPSSSSSQSLLAATYSDGSAKICSLTPEDTMETLKEWTDNRLKSGQRYVGLALSETHAYSCTSNGALRMTPIEGEQLFTTSLPSRLCDWRLSENRESFAYGGDEVDLSVWDTERSFQPQIGDHTTESTAGRKRKRDALFPCEIWRAKNAANDNLGLRQPIRITTLTYLSPSSSSNCHLLTGTQLGHVRRYDTRASRRPVSDWKNIAKTGGITTVERGFNEHEAFVGDGGSTLLSLDLRTGGVAYSYKGISGAVVSVAPSPSLLFSVSQDRYARVCSAYPLPAHVGKQQERKGEVLDKIYMKSTPTVIAWDCRAHSSTLDTRDADDDAVWDEMENIGGDSDTETQKKKRRG